MSDVARALVELGESAEISRTVSLGWYDGPLTGFLWLREPKSAWYFTLWADAPSSDDVDDRLYALTALPDDSERVVDAALTPLNPPSGRKH